MSFNWGIIGCGKISKDFANCLTKYPKSNIVACAARNEASSQQFAKLYDIPKYYSDYNDLVKDNAVDVVYIGNIHPSHYKNVINCLDHKKHVLCEKPMAMNAAQMKVMIDCAKKNNRFLMEGMWTRFFPAFRKVRQLIKDGVLGEVRHFTANFGCDMPSSDEVPRLWENRLGGGGILDLGIYVVAPLTVLYQDKYPKIISSLGKLDEENKIDTIMMANLLYGDRQFASLSCNFFANNSREFEIVGSKGRINFSFPGHAPTEFTLTSFNNSSNNGATKQTFTYDLPTDYRYGFNFDNSAGFIYQIDAVTKCLTNNLIECPEYNFDEMIRITTIMDELRSQIGVEYKEDTNEYKDQLFNEYYNKNNNNNKNDNSTKKILLVVTNTNHIKNGIGSNINIESKLNKDGRNTRQTGWYLPEVAHPYFVFKNAGFDVEIASPSGGEAEMDLNSYYDWIEKDQQCKQFVELLKGNNNNNNSDEKESKYDITSDDEGISGQVYNSNNGVNKIVVNTKSTASLSYYDYNCIFFCGGHGTCWDFYDATKNKNNFQINKMHELASNIYIKNKGIIGAVCHGPLALIGIKIPSESNSNNLIELISGKKVCGFSNEEEKIMQLDKYVPLLETNMKQNGAIFSCAKPWQSFVQSDKRVVTGQNPASATDTAEECVRWIKAGL